MTEKVIMVNGPEVWTRPGWMMNWWWIDSWMAVFHFVYRKNCRKIPENFPHSTFPEKLQPYSTTSSWHFLLLTPCTPEVKGKLS